MVGKPVTEQLRQDMPSYQPVDQNTLCKQFTNSRAEDPKTSRTMDDRTGDRRKARPPSKTPPTANPADPTDLCPVRSCAGTKPNRPQRLMTPSLGEPEPTPDTMDTSRTNRDTGRPDQRGGQVFDDSSP